MRREAEAPQENFKKHGDYFETETALECNPHLLIQQRTAIDENTSHVGVLRTQDPLENSLGPLI